MKEGDLKFFSCQPLHPLNSLNNTHILRLTSFFPPTEEKCEDSGNRNQLRFSQFNISQVLKHGASLLGSEGAEYDLAEDIGKVLPLLQIFFK